MVAGPCPSYFFGHGFLAIGVIIFHSVLSRFGLSLWWPDSYRSFGRIPATNLAGFPC